MQSILKEARNKLFKPLIEQIEILQAHIKQQELKGQSNKDRQDVYQWTQDLMTTIHDCFEGRITFLDFKSLFKIHCSKEKINHFAGYTSYIDRILQFFQKLIYSLTHLQFFKPTPTTSDCVHEIKDTLELTLLETVKQ